MNAFVQSALTEGAEAKGAQRKGRRLLAGTVWANAMLDLPVGMGYGGFRQSGIGYENGVDTLRDHQRVKGI
ncbi:MAG: aldehyde dehydrogenase family protein [Roseovarius sp.]